MYIFNKNINVHLCIFLIAILIVFRRKTIICYFKPASLFTVGFNNNDIPSKNSTIPAILSQYTEIVTFSFSFTLHDVLQVFLPRKLLQNDEFLLYKINQSPYSSILFSNNKIIYFFIMVSPFTLLLITLLFHTSQIHYAHFPSRYTMRCLRSPEGF